MINQYQLDRIWLELREEIIDGADQWLAQGLAVSPLINVDLEQRLSATAQRKHAALVANCTDALYLAMLALRLPENFRAAVPAMTWVSSASSVIRAGGVPVFYDITENYTIDAGQDFSDVDVIIAVDLLGNSCDWDRLEQTGKPIINDAAQSFGTVYHDRTSLSRGTISCTSFGPLKPLPSFGSGGCVFTDDDDLNREIKLLRLHYKTHNLDRFYESDDAVLSINSCMNSFEVSAVNVCLDHYDSWRQRRNAIADYYWDQLKDHGIEFSRRPDMPEQENALYKLALRHKNKPHIERQLHADGVQAQGLYISLTNEHRFKPYPKVNVKLASKYEFLSFTLPNQHTLTDSEVDYIVQTTKKYL